MAKIDHRNLSRTQYEQLGREFWSTCNKASSVKQLTKFLELFLTPSERVMVTRRIRIAKKLLQKKGQMQIQDTLHVGQSTVDAVERMVEKMDPKEKRLLNE